MGSIIKRSCPECYGVMKVLKRELDTWNQSGYEAEWYWVCEKCGKTEPCGILIRLLCFFSYGQGWL